MTDQYIKLSDLKAIMCEDCNLCQDPNLMCDYQYIFEKVPKADVTEIVRGSWSEADDDGEYTCSHCGWYGLILSSGKNQIASSSVDYCPNCGAKMY